MEKHKELAAKASKLIAEARAKADEAGGMTKLDAEGLKSVRAMIAEARNLQDEATLCAPASTKGRDAFMASWGRGGNGIDPTPHEWAKAVENAGGFKSLVTGVVVESKELIGAGDGSEQHFDSDIAAFGVPGRFVADACEHKGVGGTSNFAYLRQTIRDNQAAIVPSGTQKPVSQYVAERVEDSLGVLAHLSDPQDRYSLLDADYLGSFLEAEMLLGLRIAEDAHIVSSILADAAVQVVAFDTNHLRTIRKAKTALAKEFVSPTALIVNPDDAEALDLSADTQGRFYFASAPEDGDTSKTWSVPVTQSTAVATGVGLLGDFRDAVAVYEDGRTMLDSTESGMRDLDPAAIGDVEEMFATNQVRLRAETRKRAAIRKPFALVQVDLSAA